MVSAQRPPIRAEWRARFYTRTNTSGGASVDDKRTTSSAYVNLANDVLFMRFKAGIGTDAIDIYTGTGCTGTATHHVGISTVNKLVAAAPGGVGAAFKSYKVTFWRSESRLVSMWS
ncbi:hypothetical protein V5O48_010087 [Marasmius crinis-equi]|uniref:Uncharacterized protein n=1 Tax=Marasmius crinis-equi TaxID=585013 RepID=A0ABR3F9E1_9AGAR